MARMGIIWVNNIWERSDKRGLHLLMNFSQDGAVNMIVIGLMVGAPQNQKCHI